MKKTLNVNIGNMAFTIDEDAYYTLNGYYEDIRSRLYESDRREIMEDIENRTADLFRENLSFPSQVVTLGLVKRAIAIIGNASDFGEKKYDYADQGQDADPHGLRLEGKLYRSRYDKMVGGVCAGLAEYFGIDTAIVRIIMFIALFLGSLGFWVYIVLWIIVPLEPIDISAERRGYKSRR